MFVSTVCVNAHEFYSLSARRTFETVVSGLDVGLEVERTVTERREECLEVCDAALPSSGALGG